MSSPRNKTIGEVLFDDIEDNEYLNELYNELIRNYTRKLVGREVNPFDSKKMDDLLRFADVLSKSNDVNKSGIHKIWGQQIVAILDKLYPNNYKIKFFKYSVLTACNNYQGLKNEKDGQATDELLSNVVQLTDKKYFTVPSEPGDFFFEDQKSIFDGFEHQYFSYSAPTSMGKSYVMRIFIKTQISRGSNKNFAIIVPSKALINEVRTKMLEELKELLMIKNYKIVVSANDIVLEQKHNFIFIMTPERFLYLINTTDHRVQYIFIDEAHKISAKDKRGPFYYEIVNKISVEKNKPHVIFSSPNIPNPDEYLKLIPSSKDKYNKHATYSPVSQIKYLINLKTGVIEVYNDFKKEYNKIGNANKNLGLSTLINSISKRDEHNVIYCGSLKETVAMAVDYSKTVPEHNNSELIKLSNDIQAEIHSDYFLVDLLKHGIAYHVGYLPASIRIRIENAFKAGLIKTLFCTSTLIEGVNLPADNLFITSRKNGGKNLDPVSFRNLIGRVGRIDYSLFGNVFMVILPTSKEDNVEKYKELLDNDIRNQKLSIDTALSPKQKQIILNSLASGDFEMKSKPEKTTQAEFSFMRKVALILLDDAKTGKTSLITKNLSKFDTNNKLLDIKELANKIPLEKTLDISPDQHKNIRDIIIDGTVYPPLNERNGFDYKETKAFLIKLCEAFKWTVYEKNSLGNYNYAKNELTHIDWYTLLLIRWMEGNGLRYIINKSISYKEEHPETGIYLNNRKIEDFYNKNDINHKNYVIADVLNSIEQTILFSIANYFREFSMAYKKLNNVDRFDNDWYEYVEYGTVNKLTITLQRYGYSRDSALILMKDKDAYIKFQNSSKTEFLINLKEIEDSSNEGLKAETADVLLNTPELFFK